MSALDGVRAKIARARELQASLVQEAQPWVASLPNTIVVTHDAATGKHHVTIAPPPPAPTRWSVVFGEMLHDLRSALDHLTWQLVILNKKRPTRSTQFPILSKPDVERFAAQVQGIRDDHLAAIMSLQPYETQTNRPTRLELLATLSNMDKHRTPHAGLALLKPVERGSLRITFDKGTAVRNIQGAGRIRPLLTAETEIMSFVVSPTTSVVEVELNTTLSMEVAFGLRGQPIPLTRTVELVDEVERVLHIFEPAFDAAH